MSNENIGKETKKATDTGSQELTVEQKVDKLARSVFQVSQMHGNAIDTMYLQLITVIEILSDKEILTPETFEAKLEQVAKSMEERIKNAQAQQGNDREDANTAPPGEDAEKGSSKIITPSSRIIIP